MGLGNWFYATDAAKPRAYQVNNLYQVELPPQSVGEGVTIKSFGTEGAANEFIDAWWAKVPKDVGAPVNFTATIPNDIRFGALAGHKTTPEMLDMLENMGQLKPVTNPWGKAYMQMTGAVNVSKTILSHTTHVRNWFGGYAINAANGRFWYKGGKNTAASLLDDMRGLSDPDAIKRIKEWIKK